MADIRPFRGLRYSTQLITDISSVITTPSDVISPGEQASYYGRSPFNVVRLEAGLEDPHDSPGNNKYTRSAGTLRKWLDEGVLVQEERPAFYVFLHRFTIGDTEMKRLSLLARVRLEEWRKGVVCPHEVTMKEPARDRMLLLQSCKANFSPIMALVPHGAGEFLDALPHFIADDCVMEATDDYGVTHSVWTMTGEEANSALTALFARKMLYIADGHHRYETALAYRDEQRAARPRTTGEEAFNFIMMSLVDAHDPSVVVLPTHRLVRYPVDAEGMTELRNRLSSLFEMKKLPASLTSPLESARAWLDTLGEWQQRRTAFGLYGLHGKEFWLLNLREDAHLEQFMPPGKSQHWKELDVSILHAVVLQGAMGFTTTEDERCSVDYTRDPLEAITAVDSGEYQLAFFLNPMPVSSIMAICNAGDRMPQKSTYFYPKPPAGLVINPLWDSPEDIPSS
ncbi:MAG: DUF1015 domain-containing protein [Chloroflexota bacterium]